MFWLYHSKLKRPIKLTTLKSNPFYQLTHLVTFTNMKVPANIWEYKVGVVRGFRK